MKLRERLKIWWRPRNPGTTRTAETQHEALPPVLHGALRTVTEAGSKRLVDRLPEPVRAGVINNILHRVSYQQIAHDLQLRGYHVSVNTISSYAREVMGQRRLTTFRRMREDAS